MRWGLCICSDGWLGIFLAGGEASILQVVPETSRQHRPCIEKQ